MKVFFSIIAILLIITGFINLWMDPAGRFGGLDLHRTENWSREQCLISPANLDDRSLKIAHSKLVPKIGTLVLGSSRALLVDSAMFSHENSVFNSAVTAASIKDYVALWQSLKESKKIPSRLVWILDPWAFNAKYQSENWTKNADLFYRFIKDQNVSRLRKYEVLASDYYSLVMNRYAEVSELFSWATLSASLRNYFAKDAASRRDLYSVIETVKRTPFQTCWRMDGAMIYPDSANVTRPASEINRDSRTFAFQNSVYTFGVWSHDGEARMLFENMLAELNESHVSVTVMVAPYQNEAYLALRGRQAFVSGMKNFEDNIRDVQSRKAFKFCNAINPNDLGCTDVDFSDGMHALRNCVEKAIHHCI